MLRIATVLACLMAAPPARAASRVTAQAQAHIVRATAHFSAGRYDDAIVALRAAYELVPLPDHIYNIARCHEEMGRPAEAIAHFEQYLESGDDPVQVERARAGIVAGRRRLGATPPDRRTAEGEVQVPPAGPSSPA